MKSICYCWMKRLAIVLVVFGAVSCSPTSSTSQIDRSPNRPEFGSVASAGGTMQSTFVPSRPQKSPNMLYREANVKKAYIPRGKYGRKVRRYMRPRYITIHSTQNFSRGADAWQHSKALNSGSLRARKSKKFNRIGYLTWHYSVDQYRCVQHLPTNEQGEHADFNGPGNKYSIGIEMCENKGNSRRNTLNRTAKLTAWLMYKYNIPLRKVVPHYHWSRKGLSVPHKNCPYFLLDHGRPGAKWQAYLRKINKYYKQISNQTPSALPHSLPQVVTTTPAPQRVRVTPTPRTRVAPAPRKPHQSRVIYKKPSPPKPRYHIVKRGDTLYGLSKKYKTSISSIQRANKIKGTVIALGKKLKIPTS